MEASEKSGQPLQTWASSMAVWLLADGAAVENFMGTFTRQHVARPSSFFVKGLRA